jgi:nitroreductase
MYKGDIPESIQQGPAVMTQSVLSPDELLTTTRAVRKRLDLDRPVPLSLVRECVEIALQAPTGGNTQNWHFVVVMEEARRAALTELYRRAWAGYRKAHGSVYNLAAREPAGARKEQLTRVATSADFLVDHLHRVPVFVIPCGGSRVDRISGPSATIVHASFFGSIIPAVWSFMLAARARGLGTCWTTAHLAYEKEAAEILGIPYERVTQIALIPTAYAKGGTFKPSLRKPVDEILHVEKW